MSFKKTNRRAMQVMESGFGCAKSHIKCLAYKITAASIRQLLFVTWGQIEFIVLIIKCAFGGFLETLGYTAIREAFSFKIIALYRDYYHMVYPIIAYKRMLHVRNFLL